MFPAWACGLFDNFVYSPIMRLMSRHEAHDPSRGPEFRRSDRLALNLQFCGHQPASPIRRVGFSPRELMRVG
jgi:hypothetical protein